MRKIWSYITANPLFNQLAAGILALFVSSASFAIASLPTSVIVVRTLTGSLYAATCFQNTCGAFSLIPGNLSAQPTVTWDDSINGFVMVGTASNGGIYRSTFQSNGFFNNDWVALPGGAVDAVVASRSVQDGWSQYGSEYDDVTLTSSSANVVVNVISMPLQAPPNSGIFYYQCTATAFVSFNRANTTGTNTAFLGLSASSATLGNNQQWTAIDIPSGAPTGLTSVPISVTSYFPITSTTIYAVGMWNGSNTGASIQIRQPAMHCNTVRSYM